MGRLPHRSRASVRDLADEVHASAADPAARQRLPWAEAIADAPDVALPGDLAVWRAALSIPHDDLQPHWATSACRRRGTISVRPQTPPDASYATDGREAARLDKTAAAHGPTRPKGHCSSANDSPPFTMPALAWNACCARRPTSTVARRAARRCALVAHRRGGGEASIDDTEGASDERAGDPASRGKRSGYAKSISRRRRTGCCIGLIDQARPWGVRRRRAQLRVAMSRPRGTPWRVCSIFIRFRSPELAGLPNPFCVKVTTQGTDTTLWK